MHRRINDNITKICKFYKMNLQIQSDRDKLTQNADTEKESVCNSRRSLARQKGLEPPTLRTGI